jgi:fucose 4-O-acetylase-like acetyltransferase
MSYTSCREGWVRDDFEDCARGIGIVLVVYGHVLLGLMNADLVPAHHWLISSASAIYTFHMPLFFLLSGLHVERGLRRGRKSFLTSKLQTIVYPYLLWSVIQGLVQWVMSANANHRFYLSDMTDILWDPIGQFWFLYALFLCQLFVCLATAQRLRLVAVAIVGYFLGIAFGPNILTIALKYFLFFAGGILLAGNLRAIVTRCATPRGVGITFVALCVAVYLAHGVGNTGTDWALPELSLGLRALPAAVLGILLVCEIALLISQTGERTLLRVLGIASMPIYLVHILAGSGARIVLMHFHVDNLYLNLCVGVVCGLVFPLALYFVVAKMRLEKYFGFPKARAIAFEPARVADALN